MQTEMTVWERAFLFLRAGDLEGRAALMHKAIQLIEATELDAGEKALVGWRWTQQGPQWDDTPEEYTRRLDRWRERIGEVAPELGDEQADEMLGIFVSDPHPTEPLIGRVEIADREVAGLARRLVREVIADREVEETWNPGFLRKVKPLADKIGVDWDAAIEAAAATREKEEGGEGNDDK